MTEWRRFVQSQVSLQGGDSPAPKLICIDLMPNRTTLAPERSDILNVGGFSDAVFEVIRAFLASNDRFVSRIEAIEL